MINTDYPIYVDLNFKKWRPKMEEGISTTKEKVINAAKQYPEAEGALKVLYPSSFPMKIKRPGMIYKYGNDFYITASTDLGLRLICLTNGTFWNNSNELPLYFVYISENFKEARFYIAQDIYD